MAKQTDITALKNEWKNLFTQWHLSGCKEGEFYCSGKEIYHRAGSLSEYLEVVNCGFDGSANSGFTGVHLFYSNGVVSLVACCKNEIHYTFGGNIHTRNYSARDFMNTFSIEGVTSSIKKNKSCDYLILEGNLDRFENSDFFSECKKVYAVRLAAKKKKEDLFQQSIVNILNHKERVIAILQSSLLNRILSFHEINCFSFWDCNTFTVGKDGVYGEKFEGPNWRDDSFYSFRFNLGKQGYQSLDDLDCTLLAVALLLKRYEINGVVDEEVELKDLLTKAHFECEKGKIRFIYYKREEKKIVPHLKTLLE